MGSRFEDVGVVVSSVSGEHAREHGAPVHGCAAICGWIAPQWAADLRVCEMWVGCAKKVLREASVGTSPVAAS